MEHEHLIELSLDFFGLNRDFTKEEYRNRYLELVKKYHPDSSEFTSTVLFNELQRSKQVLDNYIENKENPKKQVPKKYNDKDPVFELYKLSKEIENKSILVYFEKTKGNPINLNDEKNLPLKELKLKLKEPIQNYKKILKLYPNSIWAMDARDSIKRLSVWIT